MTEKELSAKVDYLSANLFNHTQHMYIDIAGDLVAGTLLSQIMYWFSEDKNNRMRARIYRDGHFWIAKQRSDWWDEIRLTERQFDRAIKVLENKGLVFLKKYKFAGLPAIHIRPNYDALDSAVLEWKKKLAEKIAEEGIADERSTRYSSENEFGNYTKCKTGIMKSVTPLTKNTNIDYYNAFPIGKEHDVSLSAIYTLKKTNNTSTYDKTFIYTNRELSVYIDKVVKKYYLQENLVLDGRENELVNIILYFYGQYEHCRHDKHPLLAEEAYQEIVVRYLCPPGDMGLMRIYDLKRYRDMIDKYFDTDYGKRSGAPEGFDYRISHFFQDKIRENLSRQLEGKWAMTEMGFVMPTQVQGKENGSKPRSDDTFIV